MLMPRKTAATVEQAQNDIKRRYKRGPRAEVRLSSDEALSDVEREVKQGIACFLKSQDYSNGYIGDALGVSRDTVRRWFSTGDNAAELREKVLAIRQNTIDGAHKLLKSYAIELIEILVNVARTSNDDKIVIQAVIEGLDRIGLAKVNKSDSIVRTEETVDIVDRTGLLDRLKDVPPDVQSQIAQQMESAMALAAEHTGRDVTHAAV